MSAFDGMHPTFRHVPPSRVLLDQDDVAAELGGAGRGGVAAGPTADHEHVDGAGDLAGDHQGPPRKQGQRRFESAADGHAEADDVASVDDPMVGGQVDHQHPPRDDTALVVELGAASRRPEPGDADLVPVHERGAEPAAEDPVVGDGERRSAHLRRRQSTGAGRLAERASSPAMSSSERWSACRTTGSTRPSGVSTATPMWRSACRTISPAVDVDAGVEHRVLGERQRRRLHEERRDRHRLPAGGRRR